MSSTPLQSDLMLWSMLRTRRRRVRMHRGLDSFANRWIAQARHIKSSLNALRQQAELIVGMEKQWAELSDEALDQKVIEIRAVFARRRQTTQDVQIGFAAVRELAYRTLGERPYMVQIMGALGLYHGQIVEMVTGEGKTLTASLTTAILGWMRRPVHVITVNDYLAERDADTRNVLYRRCGLLAAAVTADTPPPKRLEAYRQPIVYASAKEIMADWLRDQLQLGRITDPVSTRWKRAEPWMPDAKASALGPMVMVPGLFAAIVDEIDAILIDEAVTPLIIAQERGTDPHGTIYKRSLAMGRQLKPKEHYKLYPNDRHAELTDAGREALAQLVLPDDHAIFRANRRREELVCQAIAADIFYRLGEQYHLVEDKVVIVDEYTGRFMQDRQWQHGLHQAVEAKHDIPITADRDTLASISFQRFFRQYPLLSGMTGTAAEAKPEMERTYGLPVRVIPTNKPIQRKSWPDRVFLKASEKWVAVANSIAEIHAQGRPILVGTRSIETSEQLSELLKQRGLEHEILNAIHHKIEAQIISRAGQRGAITVATNMAGRGTDIKLGPGVADLGGLHILLTERSTAKRVDRQFVGRAGRQGDPGSSQVFCSIEDDLMVKNANWLVRLLKSKYDKNNRRELPGWTVKFFDWAQRWATHRSFYSRLQLIRHEQELEKTLPG